MGDTLCTRDRLGDPPALDPVADLKLHQLDLVEAIHERQALLQVCALSL